MFLSISIVRVCLVKKERGLSWGWKHLNLTPGSCIRNCEALASVFIYIFPNGYKPNHLNLLLDFFFKEEIENKAKVWTGQKLSKTEKKMIEWEKSKNGW